MKCLIFSCCFLCIALSCRKECFTTSGINGQWIWVKSVGGFAGSTLTPKTEHKTQKLKIDDFVFRLYVNDTLVIEEDYTLTKDTLAGTDAEAYLVLKSGLKQLAILENNELQLIDLCADCYSHYYKRD